MEKHIILTDLLANTVKNNIEKITDTIFKINAEVIEILDVNFDTKALKIRHNHTTHNLVFKSELDLVLDKMGIKRTFEAVNTDVKAPMPGKVLDVIVNVGDEVKKGDAILILEAMKMENVLKAEGDCIIKSVLVDNQQSVEKNQVLIELED
ncbi:MAG: acetyl-CoA carboxylase biotin carboxyl carrier protein subunit [Putridiphycobacter sp.]